MLAQWKATAVFYSRWNAADADLRSGGAARTGAANRLIVVPDHPRRQTRPHEQRERDAMPSDNLEQTGAYTVVVNDEEQYSLWPLEHDLPAGWRVVGTAGTRAECLAQIERIWTDMRPRSLRAHTAAVGESR
jgi:MbtH protein